MQRRVSQRAGGRIRDSDVAGSDPFLGHGGFASPGTPIATQARGRHSDISGYRVRQRDPAGAMRNVELMQTAHAKQMSRQRFPERLREHHSAVAVPLPGSDHDLVLLKIHVLDSELGAFQKAKTGSIQQRRHYPSHARQVGQDGSDFFAAQYDGKASRTPGADETVEPRHIDGQDTPVEEE
jgi:hypothetical protein